MRTRGRFEDTEAMRVMQQRGLRLHPVSPAEAEAWRQLAAQLNPRIRGTIVPAEIFDAVERNLREFRATPPASP